MPKGIQGFQKGHKAWNKGIPRSEKVKNKISETRTRYTIPQKFLEELYITQKLNSKECSNLFGCSNVTILNKLKQYNIPVRTTGEAHRGMSMPHKGKQIAKKKLIELYVDKRLTARECGHIFGCSYGNVLNKLKQYNIHVRTNSEVNRGIPRPNREKKIKETKLKGLYINKNLTMVQCGEFFNCSNVTIKDRLIKLSIPIRDLSESHKGYTWPEERKETYSVKVSGKNNPSWIDGRSFLPYPIEFNRQLKELIRNRDNYQCQKCGMPECENIERLSIHHIDYNRENCLPSNLTSLCRSCNAVVNNDREYWEQYFKEKILC